MRHPLRHLVAFARDGAVLQNLFIVALVLFLISAVILGFTWMRSDANRAGKHGTLWALATIPFSWIAVLAYLVSRELVPRRT